MFRANYDVDSSMFISGRNHQGVVIDNSSDTTKSGKLRIRIAALHVGIPDEDLPYMMPAAGGTDTQSNGQSMGSVNVPAVGSIVWARFDQESVYHGFYHGNVPTPNAAPNQFAGKSPSGAGATPDPDTNTDPDSGQYPITDDQNVFNSYPFAKAHVDQSGHQTIINNKTDMNKYVHVSGTGESTDAAGSHVRQVGNYNNPNPNADTSNPKGDNLNVQGPKTDNVNGNYTIYVHGNVIIDASGDVTISSQGKVTIKSAKVLDITSQDTINISATNKITLQAGIITSQPPITTGPGISPLNPDTPTTTPKVPNRTRPQLPQVANLTNFGAPAANNSYANNDSQYNIPDV